MNPNSATLRSTDLCALLNVSDQAVYRWLARPYPIHHFSQYTPRGRTYALPEIVARTRERRKAGLSGTELLRVVAFDTHVRAERTSKGVDDLWLGDDDPMSRVAAFRAVLSSEESERQRLVQKSVTGAAMATGAPSIEWLRQIVLIHPAIARFILANESEELPVGEAGWRSFVKAVSVVNPIPQTIEKEAA